MNTKVGNFIFFFFISLYFILYALLLKHGMSNVLITEWDKFLNLTTSCKMQYQWKKCPFIIQTDEKLSFCIIVWRAWEPWWRGMKYCIQRHMKYAFTWFICALMKIYIVMQKHILSVVANTTDKRNFIGNIFTRVWLK